MTHDTLELLSSILVYAGQEITAGQFAGANELDQFIRAGWIVPAGWPTTISCEICDEAHPAELIARGDRPLALCLRSSETFSVSKEAALFRVNAGAVAQSVSLALKITDKARNVKGAPTLWRLGDRRLLETRVVFFFTPQLAELDGASTIIDLVAVQSGASRSGLIVASDNLDHVRLLSRKTKVLRLRDVASIVGNGAFEIDEGALATAVLPDLSSARSPGAPATQRKRILNVLEALVADGWTVDTSNEKCRDVQERFEQMYPADNIPVNATIRSAIKCMETN